MIWWAHIESNYGPLSYQESVLPLNYAPELINLSNDIVTVLLEILYLE
jgi:hypothetical protein